MWMAGGVEEDDKLDRDTSLQVLRRTWRMLDRSRRRVVLAAVLAIVYTASTLAGPLLVRTGIDDGIKADDGALLNRVVVAYIVVAALSYVV